MRRIAHISDLHFGRIEGRIVDGLLADLVEQSPDVIIISGDLTQRARRHQFAAARAFIDQLPAPTLVLPGNHDVAPMWKPLHRLAQPFARYRAFIAEDLSPSYCDEEIAVLGVNTARGFKWKEGRISSVQVTALRNRLTELQHVPFKIVFTHHPFIPPPDAPGTSIIGEAPRALAVMEALKVDLLLAGHLHRGYVGDVTTHHTTIKRSMLVAQASTTTSTRLRAEPNAYNLLEVDPARVDLTVRHWQGGAFRPARQESYAKQDERWYKTRDAPAVEPVTAPLRA